MRDRNSIVNSWYTENYHKINASAQVDSIFSNYFHKSIEKDIGIKLNFKEHSILEIGGETVSMLLSYHLVGLPTRVQI